MNRSTSDPNAAGAQRTAMPRVLIADPSVLVIERLAASIDDVALVIGRATNAHDALTVVRNGDPQVTVFDVAIDHGIDLLRQIKARQPPLIAIVLTHSAEETTRHYCMRLGVEYFLDKIRDFHRVREIVIAVGGGGKPAAAGPPALQ
jgi:DNA-binding NarL/FixJ family response regulator